MNQKLIVAALSAVASAKDHVRSAVNLNIDLFEGWTVEDMTVADIA
jgi:hypothetical protein